MCVVQSELKDKVKVEEEKKDEEKEDPKGIPEFWLTVFKNVDLLSEMLQVRTSPVFICSLLCRPLLFVLENCTVI